MNELLTSKSRYICMIKDFFQMNFYYILGKPSMIQRTTLYVDKFNFETKLFSDTLYCIYKCEVSLELYTQELFV